MRTLTVLAVILAAAMMAEARKKPMCEMCENLVEKVDEILKKGGDVEEV